IRAWLHSLRSCYGSSSLIEDLYLRGAESVETLESTEIIPNAATPAPKELNRWVSIGIVAAAVLLGAFVLYHTNHSPRTDDAEVFANFIGIAPQVEGPIVRMNVRDNQFVKKGELLYEIDERPYQYALERALSEQAALEGQVADEQRKINALVSGVSVAKANISS